MEKLHSRSLRRWRAEWAPTAWDLNVPASVDTRSTSSDTAIQAWLARMCSGHADSLDTDALLYPQGFALVQLEGESYFCAVPEALRGQVWSLWEGRQQCSRHEARIVLAETMDQEWRRYKTPGSPPLLSDSAIAWVVTFDGEVFELHPSDFVASSFSDTDVMEELDDLILDFDPQEESDDSAVEEELGILGADAPEYSAEPVMQLPETMMSFLFELDTKGTRRFCKQSIMGACIVLVSFALAGIIPSSEFRKPPAVFDILQLVWITPGLIGLYQWFVARWGIRQAQLAQAVSRGAYKDARLSNGRVSGRLAPWFYWSIVKRVAAAVIVPLGLATLIGKSGMGLSPVLAAVVPLCLVAAACLIAIDALAFGFATDTHGAPFEIERWR